VDRATRKELKSDKFALEVQHGVQYVTGHQQMLIRYGGIAAAVIVVIFGLVFYFRHQSAVRQQALQNAMRVESAGIGPAQGDFALTYPTQADKDKAVDKAWLDLAAKYPGTNEGAIAEYFLGSHAADKGNLQEAEKRFKLAADTGSAPYASLAKLSLAQVYAAENRVNDAKALLQSLIDHPTITVSKEAATIAMAHVIASSDPQGARKLLEPLRGSERSQVSTAALTAISSLSK